MPESRKRPVLALCRCSPPPLVRHREKWHEQGSQITAEDFTNAVLCKGVKPSMNGCDLCCDNVFVEHLWRSVKTSGYT
jgi:hypothetical protein